MEGEPAFEYLEEMEIDDRAAFEAEIEASEAMGAMLEQWYERIADQVIVFAEEVEQT
jgi:anti-sigma-K factor RskA